MEEVKTGDSGDGKTSSFLGGSGQDISILPAQSHFHPMSEFLLLSQQELLPPNIHWPLLRPTPSVSKQLLCWFSSPSWEPSLLWAGAPSAWLCTRFSLKPYKKCLVLHLCGIVSESDGNRGWGTIFSHLHKNTQRLQGFSPQSLMWTGSRRPTDV